MNLPPASPRRSITIPMMVIGFVAGVLTIVILVRYFH